MPSYVKLNDGTTLNLDASAAEVRTMIDSSLKNRGQTFALITNDGNGTYYLVPDAVSWVKEA